MHAASTEKAKYYLQKNSVQAGLAMDAQICSTCTSILLLQTFIPHRILRNHLWASSFYPCCQSKGCIING